MKENELIEKAANYFLQNGYRASLDDFAKTERISKKTIYKYYRSKEDLIKAVFQKRQDQIFDILSHSPGEENALSQMLTNNLDLREYIKPAQQRRNLTELKHYYPAIFDDLMTKIGDIIYQTLTPIVERGIEEGIFLPQLNPETVATIYRNFFLLLRTMKTEEPEIVNTISDTSFLMFVRSLLTTKGFEIYDQEEPRILKNYTEG